MYANARNAANDETSGVRKCALGEDNRRRGGKEDGRMDLEGGGLECRWVVVEEEEELEDAGGGVGVGSRYEHRLVASGCLVSGGVLRPPQLVAGDCRLEAQQA
jgi:hypothetical protein